MVHEQRNGILISVQQTQYKRDGFPPDLILDLKQTMGIMNKRMNKHRQERSLRACSITASMSPTFEFAFN